MKDTVRNDKENVLELKNKMVGRILSTLNEQSRLQRNLAGKCRPPRLECRYRKIPGNRKMEEHGGRLGAKAGMRCLHSTSGGQKTSGQVCRVLETLQFYTWLNYQQGAAIG